MARIENHKYSVAEAFQECFYVVPDYQREYVWTDKEVQQLLEDIDEQIDSGSDKEYFVGMILVSPGSQKNHFEVIDGQQRLTTFYLLLCALRHRFKGTAQHQAINGLISASYATRDGDIKTSLKLEPRYENADELMQCLVAQDEEPAKVRHAVQQAGIAQFGSLDNLLNAYGTVYRYLLDNYEDQTSLKKLWGYLANNVVFIQISTDVSSALKIFETINERGVGLNPMDLLKNLLFTQVDQTDFTKLKNEWKKITAPLEKAKEKPLRFLRYFLMANYKITNKDSIVREDEIYDWFVNKDNANLCEYGEKPFEFVRKIIRNLESYLAFSEGHGNNGHANVPMANLKKMCGGAFSLHYVLLLALANVPKSLFDHFVVQLESFLFYYIFTKTPTKELERSFSQWAEELRVIAGLKDAETQKQKLNEFIDKRFRASMAKKSNELSDALKRYTIRSMQQYRTRYLLAKLTQYVDMAYKGVTTPGSLDDYMVLEIEHILPNTPEPELRQSFSQSSPGANYDEYKNKLGNFTLLEKPINIVASNSFFEVKKAEYKKCKHYLTSSIVELTVVGKNSSINRINEKLKAFNSWSAASIDQRQAMLIELAKVVWNTSLIGDAMKVLNESSQASAEAPLDKPSGEIEGDEDEDITANDTGPQKTSLETTKHDLEIRRLKLEALSKRNPVEVMQHYLNAPANDEGKTPAQIYEEVDKDRATLIDGTLKPLVADYLAGKLTLETFKPKNDGINKEHRRWGFQGIKGQMFFNLVVNVAGDAAECDKAIKTAIAVPANEDGARSQINTFASYVRRIGDAHVKAGGSKQGRPKPNSIPFFLSYFWQVQDRHTWPIYYTNAVNTMGVLGLWKPDNDLAENYIAFKHLYEKLAQKFFQASGTPFDLYGVEHVFWFIGEHPFES